MIEWCQSNLSQVTVTTNDIAPPLPFDAESFDLVHAISLFTHLNADAQRQWIREVHRVLRPGGLLLFTTHGEIFTNQLSTAQREAFARGQVVVRNPEVNGAQPCASYHPPAHVRGELLPRAGFELIDTMPGGWARERVWTAMVLQDKYLALKPRLAEPASSDRHASPR
jgi:SAM-dependent methyltransferase